MTVRGEPPATQLGSAPAGPAELPEQRRILRVLVVSQVLSGAGLAAGITVGALIAEDMLGSTGLAGVPSALFTAGAALGAAGIGRICARWGRRPGLALGYGAGALGSVGVVAAAATGQVVALFLALLVYGAGTSTNLMARYAGADLASPARRGRAVSTVLFATTLGAVVGPNLAGPTGDVAGSWGIPPLAGPFLLAAVAYGAAAIVLGCALRPDPLRLARALAEGEADAIAPAPPEAPAPPTAPTAPAATTTSAALRNGRDAKGERTGAASAAPAAAPSPEVTDVRGVATGTAVMVLGQLVMIAIMTMTPVHMRAHDHSTQASGLVIALHVGAMFLPSPLTGRLVDRFGRIPVAAASGVTLFAAGVLAALAPSHSVPALAVALVLLGLGWNFGLVSGTALVTDALPPARRASAQGLVDVGIALAGATGGLSSGMVVAGGSYPALALTGGLLALAIAPLLLPYLRSVRGNQATAAEVPAEAGTAGHR
ncbi:MFS transporter [Streptomyces sp. NPDC001922]|uniref:MFS transporter n=1 Tax=Streptomyces sp. NPDC001922 TaxID=3364624 RepID=UPI0036A4FC3E